MQLFVGLGNPGRKYAGNRHNIGFMAIDAIASAHGFGPWRQKFQAEIAEGRLGGLRVTLLKPQTFMNLSGQSVGEAMRYLKLTPGDVCVFHDELDLAPGKIRVKTGGGHAGHNGLRSLHQHLGPDYHRVRMGIGHPGQKELVTNYVLQDFAKSDREWLDPLIEAVGREAGRLAAGDAPGFMSAIALATGSGRSGKPDPVSTPAEPGRSENRQPDQAAAKPDSGPESPLQRLLARFTRQ